MRSRIYRRLPCQYRQHLAPFSEPAISSTSDALRDSIYIFNHLAFFISTKSMSVSFIHHQCQTMPLYLTLLSSTSPSSSFLKLLYYTQSCCLPHRLSLPHCFHLHAISLQHSRHIQIVTLRHFPNTLPPLFHIAHSFLSPSLHIQSTSISWQHPHDACRHISRPPHHLFPYSKHLS